MPQVVEPEVVGQVELVPRVSHGALDRPWAAGVAPLVVEERAPLAEAARTPDRELIEVEVLSESGDGSAVDAVVPVPCLARLERVERFTLLEQAEGAGETL